MAANGMLAFSDAEDVIGEVTWVDREGKRLETVNPEIRGLQGIGLAHGERRLAYGSGNPSDIWVQNLPTGEPSRVAMNSARSASR